MFEFLNRKYNILRITLPEGVKMTFKEFTLKYWGTTNPATGKSWTLEDIRKDSGLDMGTVTEYLNFFVTVQKTMVATQNRMPAAKDIILAHDGPDKPVVEPPKPPVSTTPSTDKPRSPWNPSGTMTIGQLTVPQFEDLMIHVLKEHFPS